MKAAHLLLLILLTGCMTEQKATSYLVSKKKLPGICARLYPVKTVFLEGKTIVKSDTVTQIGDSIPCPPVVNQEGKTVYVKVKCPDNKHIRDTIFKTDTIQVENTARVLDLQFTIGNRDAEILFLKDKVESLERYKLWGIITWVIIGLLGAFMIFIRIKNR